MKSENQETADYGSNSQVQQLSFMVITLND